MEFFRGRFPWPFFVEMSRWQSATEVPLTNILLPLKFPTHASLPLLIVNRAFIGSSNIVSNVNLANLCRIENTDRVLYNLRYSSVYGALLRNNKKFPSKNKNTTSTLPENLPTIFVSTFNTSQHVCQRRHSIFLVSRRKSGVPKYLGYAYSHDGQIFPPIISSATLCRSKLTFREKHFISGTKYSTTVTLTRKCYASSSNRDINITSEQTLLSPMAGMFCSERLIFISRLQMPTTNVILPIDHAREHKRKQTDLRYRTLKRFVWPSKGARSLSWRINVLPTESFCVTAHRASIPS